MGDQHHAAAELAQQAFEPLDGVEVEVVGGLVEQQHVGPAHQRLRQRHALAHAARQRADARLGIEVQAVQRLVDALLPVPAVVRLDAALQRVEVAVAVGVVVDAGDDVGAGRRCTASNTVRVVGRAPAPARRRRCAGPAGAGASPSSGRSKPARIFSSEDLPAPLRPIRPTRSPASSEKSAWSSRATWPKASWASASVIRAMGSRESQRAYHRSRRSAARLASLRMGWL